MNPPVRSYFLSLILLFATLVLSVAIGSVFIPPGMIGRSLLAQLPLLSTKFEIAQIYSTILFQIRLPHAILIAFTGMALAGSGAAYQGLFRNPLADPYLLGVASGAGLGAVVAMSLQWPNNIFGYFTVPVFAFIGAMFTVLAVYWLARTGGGLQTTTLILAGVAVGSFAAALTSYLMLQSQGEIRRAIAWLLGGSTLSGWAPVIAALPYLLIGLCGLLVTGHALNVLQYGDEQAQQLGLPVERVKLLLIITASLTTAVAVSFSGIIGFIGLIIPHMIRMLVGPDYRHLIPLSILGGASALLFADILARTIIAPQELPVGVITALAGAPFFIWILRRYQRKAFST